MRRLAALSLVMAAAWSGCARNPVGPPTATGLNNSTTYYGVVEQASNDVLYAPSNASQVTTSSPFFGGPVEYSWGGASRTITQASAPNAIAGSGPNTSVWILTRGQAISPGVFAGNGIGGPTSNDAYIRWSGFKGPDPNLDYSSMSMFLAGATTNYNLAAHHYRGILFYARGHGNYEVTISGNNLGSPPYYSGYNFYSYNFGPSLTGDDQWHEFTVQFSDMIQTYGQAADLNHVLTEVWGLQFDQLAPLTQNFQLDVEYVRFF
jgi:hypothetical protein